MSDSESDSMRKVPLGGLATGLERQGAVTRQGSTPLPSSSCEDCHHWSGWPGAICLKCGSEDPMEIALADDTIDLETRKFRTEEQQMQFDLDVICSVKGALAWNSELTKWELTGG